jgi:hypothetical protein
MNGSFEPFPHSIKTVRLVRPLPEEVEACKVTSAKNTVEEAPGVAFEQRTENSDVSCLQEVRRQQQIRALKR